MIVHKYRNRDCHYCNAYNPFVRHKCLKHWRGVTCKRCLAGIEDPAAFMDDARKMVEAMRLVDNYFDEFTDCIKNGDSMDALPNHESCGDGVCYYVGEERGNTEAMVKAALALPLALAVKAGRTK